MISEAKENYDRLAGVSSGQAHQPCRAKTWLPFLARASLCVSPYHLSLRAGWYLDDTSFEPLVPPTFCANISVNRRVHTAIVADGLIDRRP